MWHEDIQRLCWWWDKVEFFLFLYQRRFSLERACVLFDVISFVFVLFKLIAPKRTWAFSGETHLWKTKTIFHFVLSSSLLFRILRPTNIHCVTTVFQVDSIYLIRKSAFEILAFNWDWTLESLIDWEACNYFSYKTGHNKQEIYLYLSTLLSSYKAIMKLLL